MGSWCPTKVTQRSIEANPTQSALLCILLALRDEISRYIIISAKIYFLGHAALIVLWLKSGTCYQRHDGIAVSKYNVLVIEDDVRPPDTCRRNSYVIYTVEVFRVPYQEHIIPRLRISASDNVRIRALWSSHLCCCCSSCKLERVAQKGLHDPSLHDPPPTAVNVFPMNCSCG